MHVVTQGFFILFGSGIVVCARVEAGTLAGSEAGWQVLGDAATLDFYSSVSRRCGDPGLTTNCTSALRRRLALAGRTKCVDTLYDIRRRIGCKVVRFVRL